MRTDSHTERLQKELTPICGGKVAQQIQHMWSQRQKATVNDGCGETDVTDGEERKRRMFDNFCPTSMKG